MRRLLKKLCKKAKKLYNHVCEAAKRVYNNIIIPAANTIQSGISNTIQSLTENSLPIFAHLRNILERAFIFFETSINRMASILNSNFFICFPIITSMLALTPFNINVFLIEGLMMLTVFIGTSISTVFNKEQ